MLSEVASVGDAVVVTVAGGEFDVTEVLSVGVVVTGDGVSRSCFGGVGIGVGDGVSCVVVVH